MDTLHGNDPLESAADEDSAAKPRYMPRDLEAEVARKIEWLQRNNGRTLHPDFIANAVVTDHPHIEGDDSDFYFCCARAHAREVTRRQLNRFKARAEAEVDAQLVLEGFERLQKYYLVSRDEEQVAVRVDDLTDAEIDVKIAELRAMAVGCYQHVDELIRYRDRRNAA